MNRKTPVAAALALSLSLALALAGCGGAPAGDAPAAVTASSEKKLLEHTSLGGDFTLTDHHGEPFRLSSTDGRIRLLFFGYATCPDVCPQTLSRVTRVHDLLGAAGDEVLTLFVSVDPERDTPAKLAEYLDYFRVGDVVALTGSDEEIAAVVKSFAAYFEKREVDSAAGYLIDHSAYLYLIDRHAVVRAVFRPTEDPEEIAAAIRVLQGEQPATQARG